jgi:hypothetical protein
MVIGEEGKGERCAVLRRLINELHLGSVVLQESSV